MIEGSTGKYLSETLIFAWTNPQCDNRLFIELRVQYKKIASSEQVENMLCTQIGFLFLFWYSEQLEIGKIGGIKCQQ